MSHSHRKRHPPAHQPAGGTAPNAASGRLRSLRARWRAWRQSKNPVLLFVAIFGLMMTLYYVATLSPFFHHTLFPGCLRFNAEVSTRLLRLLGHDAVVSGTSISAGGFTIDIRRGCDAIEASAVFLSAVLAFPGRWQKKLPGMIAGVLLLQALNQVRILSLLLIGLHWPGAFHTMHAEVWQIVFILAALVLWAVWIQWTLRQATPQPVAHAA